MWLWAETSSILYLPLHSSMPSCELTFRYTFFSHRQTHEKALTRCEHPHSWQQLLYFSPALCRGIWRYPGLMNPWNQNMAEGLPVALASFFLFLKLGAGIICRFREGLPRTVGSDYRCERKYWQPERGST